MKTINRLLFPIAAIAIILLSAFTFLQPNKPVLYIIGDSTVKNGSGQGSDQLWGWGSFIQGYFDTSKISVQNHAIGGRSSRTFITEGRWDKITAVLKKGDYVMMQFGHNDGGPLDDTARARGTIKGIGTDSVKTYNPIRKVDEVVYTYGYYMRKMISEAKAKGAVVIVCSPVPRNNFADGKVKRGNMDYPLWSKQLAATSNSLFIDLHNQVADKYDAMGQPETAKFFPKDNTHTNEAGARLTAQVVIDNIKTFNSLDLPKYLK